MPKEALAPEVETEEDIAPEEEAEVTEETEAAEEPKEVESPETLESVAEQLGWKPKKNFQGEDDTFVDAKTYILRSKDIQDSLRKHLKENKQKMTSLEKGLEDLKFHNERVFKTQLAQQKKQIEELKAQRKEAIEEGDVEKVDKLEVQMNELMESDNSDDKPAPKVDPEVYETFSGWIKENTWYDVQGLNEGDTDLTQYANYVSDLPEYKGLPYAHKLKKVTEKVKEMFPEHFQKTPQPKAARNPVEAPNLKSMKGRFTARDLNDTQKSVMRNFIKQGIMTEKEYIDDLVKIGELA
jgi:hypothetical protein